MMKTTRRELVLAGLGFPSKDEVPGSWQGGKKVLV
jgi:hypothetical protein